METNAFVTTTYETPPVVQFRQQMYLAEVKKYKNIIDYRNIGILVYVILNYWWNIDIESSGFIQTHFHFQPNGANTGYRSESRVSSSAALIKTFSNPGWRQYILQIIHMV